MASAVPYVAGHVVGHERITIEHVMLSLSFDEEIEARLHTKGVDADGLRHGLREELARVPRVPDLKTIPQLDSRCERVVKLAAVGRAYATPRSLLGRHRRRPGLDRAHAPRHTGSASTCDDRRASLGRQTNDRRLRRPSARRPRRGFVRRRKAREERGRSGRREDRERGAPTFDLQVLDLTSRPLREIAGLHAEGRPKIKRAPGRDDEISRASLRRG